MSVLRYGNPKHQRGAVLVFSLVFLLIFTIMGVNSMDTAMLESRMAGSIRQHQSDLMLAEFTLRRIERQLTGNNVIPDTVYCRDLDQQGRLVVVCSYVEQLEVEGQDDVISRQRFLVSAAVNENDAESGTVVRSVVDVRCESDSCSYLRSVWEQGSHAEKDTAR